MIRPNTECDTCGKTIGGKPLITVTMDPPKRQVYEFDTVKCFMAHPEGGNGGQPRE